MNQLPVETYVDVETGDICIKQRLSLHDPQDWIEVRITQEQAPQLARELTKFAGKKPGAGNGEAGTAERFETHFWHLYPNISGRRVDKKACLQVWKQRGLDAKAEDIASALRRFAESDDWIKDKGKFIPMSTTWLRQSRWESLPPGPGGGSDYMTRLR
jgi:hypothetical protein